MADSTVVSGLSIPPQSVTATTSGAGVDFQQSDLPVQALCDVGSVLNVAAANTATFSFQESSDNATWTAVADSRATLTAIGAANTLQIASFSRTKRYVRAVVTIAGSNDAFLVSCRLLAQQRLTNPGPGYSLSPQV